MKKWRDLILYSWVYMDTTNALSNGFCHVFRWKRLEQIPIIDSVQMNDEI